MSSRSRRILQWIGASEDTRCWKIEMLIFTKVNGARVRWGIWMELAFLLNAARSFRCVGCTLTHVLFWNHVDLKIARVYLSSPCVRWYVMRVKTGDVLIMYYFFVDLSLIRMLGIHVTALCATCLPHTICLKNEKKHQQQQRMSVAFGDKEQKLLGAEWWQLASRWNIGWHEENASGKSMLSVVAEYRWDPIMAICCSGSELCRLVKVFTSMSLLCDIRLPYISTPNSVQRRM